MNDTRDPAGGWSAVPNWVIRSGRLSGNEKLLYIALLNRADSQGICWPSIETLRRDVGCSKNTILKLLRTLEDKRLVTRRARLNNDGSRASNSYQVHAWRGGAASEQGGAAGERGVVQPVNGGGANEYHEVLPIEVLPIRSTYSAPADAGRESDPDRPPAHYHHDGNGNLRDLARGDEVISSAADCKSLTVEIPDTVEDDFAEWYAAYPRKRGKGQALKAYRAARKKVDAATLLEAIEAQAPALIARGSQYCPYPATWLNGQRWADDLDEVAPSQPARPNRVQENAAIAQAMLQAEQGRERPRREIAP